MTERAFSLSIPIDRWAAEDYVPAAAAEAAELGATLRIESNSLDQLVIRRTGVESEPESFDVTSRLFLRSGDGFFATQLQVGVVPRDGKDRDVAEIAICVTTRWSFTLDSDDILDDTAETFAVSLGALEPTTLAASALTRALEMLGVKVVVSPDDNLELNRTAVLETAEQPPMSSDAASPLNPYALAGIAGERAEAWAGLGFSASFAGHWATAGFEPAAASEWVAGGFSPDDAAEWTQLSLEPHDALLCVAGGAGPEEVARQAAAGVHPYDFAALVGLVPMEEIPDWVNAIIARDLLDAGDVPVLIRAGLMAFDVATAPEDLTAGEIIHFYADESDLDEAHDMDSTD
ncbi:MAG TPA: hypothetical protein VIR30_16900 [Nocardioides sp.]